MPISGSDPALMVARLGVMRLGATRLAYYPPAFAFSIAGVPITQPVIRVAELQITDYLDGQPNLATFRMDTITPLPGQEIRIGLGGLGASETYFAGNIQTVNQVYEADVRQHVAWDVTAISYEWLMNRRRVTKRYLNERAGAIAIDVIGNFTSGFTSHHVDPNLAVIPEFTFTHAFVTDALDQLARAAGGYWFVDTQRDLHFFTEAADQVHPITDADDHSAADLAKAEDLEPVRTRVLVEGGGSDTTIPIDPGATTIPLEDVALFAAGGGTAVQDTQRFTYTGTIAADVAASNVGGAPGPAAPTAALTTGIGDVIGTVRYRVSLRRGSSETVPGDPSGPVTGIAVTPPTAPTALLALTGGPLAGEYSYGCTFVTSRGETTMSGLSVITTTAVAAPGTISVAPHAGAVGRLVGTFLYALTFVTARGETAPGADSAAVTATAHAAPPAVTIAATGSIGPLVGTYRYKITGVTALGETLPSLEASRTAAAVAAPTYSVLTLAEVSTTIGRLIGAYTYRVSFVTVYGETLTGNATTITPAAHTGPGGWSWTASGTGVGPIAGVSYAYKVSFVSELGESLSTASTSATITGVTATAPSVTVNSGTGENGYAVTWVHPEWGESEISGRTVISGTNNTVFVTNLPAGCGWNVYATGTVPAGNGATAVLYRVAERAVGAASFTHTTQTGPQASVRATLGRAVVVSGIPAGPTGTTARRVYRTRANAPASFLLVGQIDGNAAGASFTDTVPDAALTTFAPTSNLNGKQITITIPTGPATTIARRLYRSRVGNSGLYLHTQIDGNGSATVTDNQPDEALTVLPPTVATAGGEEQQVNLLAGPTGTIARRLYRTTAGGSEFRLLAEIPNNTAPTYLDAKADSELGATTEPVTSTAGGQAIDVIAIPVAPAGVTARRLYRRRSGTPTYRLVAPIEDGASTYLDDRPDDALGEPPPIASTAGGQSVQVTLPIGPTGTTARRFYRSRSGGGALGYAGAISGNVTPAIVDDRPDDALGEPPPLVNTAGGSMVALSNLPIGPTGTTARRIYRTKGGGADYFYLRQITDNTTLSYTDDASDDDLHDLAPTASTIGALAGDTSLRLESTTGFPAGGWVRADSQVLRYTGVSGAFLTGMPASGLGAITAAIAAGSAVLVEPHLIGVVGVSVSMPAGTTIHLLVTRDDAAAQAVMAARVGGDGITEEYVTDDRLSVAEAIERGDAKLLELKDPVVTIRYRTHDRTTRSGREVTINVGAPNNIVGTYKIQQVTYTEFDPLMIRFPLCTVTASSRRASFDAIVRLLKGYV